MGFFWLETCLFITLCLRPHCLGKVGLNVFILQQTVTAHIKPSELSCALVVSCPCGETEVLLHRPTGKHSHYQICAQFIPARTSLTLPFKSIQKEATETVCQLLSEEKPNERGHNSLGFIFPLFVLGDVWARPNNGMKNCETCRQV